MKNIFRSLGVLTLLLAFAGQALATDYTFKGKVRYMIETKKLTLAEAQAITNSTDKYVDLWTYILIDEEFATGNPQVVVTKDGSGNITHVYLRTGSNTHSFKMVKKDGVTLETNTSVANFAGALAECSVQQEATSDGLCERTFGGCCPSWYYMASGDPFSIRDRDIEDFVEEIEIDGKKWYAIKQYTIRFAYKLPQSFYTTFYVEDGTANDPKVELGNPAPGTDACLHGSSNMNFYYTGVTGTNRIFGQGVPRDGQDWSFYWQYSSEIGTGGSVDMYGIIPGGVEIIADPEFTLAASATCGGSDLQGTFKVNNWNGKSWSDYTAVKMYVNTAGGTRKALSIGTDLVFSGPALCNASGTITATGTTADFNYTLASSAYMMNGAPADSLIWAFEDIKITLI